jgi:hypothetical protein
VTGLDVFAAAHEVEQFFQSRGWRFCFIGGLAVQRWGEPRFTQDVDATLLTGWGSEASVVDEVLKQFEARHPGARAFAIEHRVLLLRTRGGISLDFALGALDFEARMISRATAWNAASGITLTTCSAEDLIVQKVFAGRGRDWDDVAGILDRQKGRLDLSLVRSELPALLEMKDDAESLRKFEEMVQRVNQR